MTDEEVGIGTANPAQSGFSDTDVGLVTSQQPEVDKELAKPSDYYMRGKEMVGQKWIDLLKKPSPAWMQPAEAAIRKFATTPPSQIPVTEQSPGYQKLAAGIWNPLMGFATLENAALAAGYAAQPELGAALIAAKIAPSVKPWWQQIKRLPQATPLEGLELGTQTWSMLAAPFIHRPPAAFTPAAPMPIERAAPRVAPEEAPPASRRVPSAPSVPPPVPREPSPAEAAGQPTATRAEATDSANARLKELEAMETPSPQDLTERDFLRKNKDDYESIAEAYGFVISDPITGGETDASRVAETEGMVLRGERRGVVPETPLRQPREAAQIQEEPVSTGQPVAAPPPEGAYEPIPAGIAWAVPHIEYLRDAGFSRDQIRDAFINRQRQKGFSTEQIAYQLPEITSFIKRIVPEEPGAAPAPAIETPPKPPSEAPPTAAEPSEPVAGGTMSHKGKTMDVVRVVPSRDKPGTSFVTLRPTGKPKAKETVIQWPVTERKPRTFKTKFPVGSFGSELTPIASHILNETNGIMSKRAAKAKGIYERNKDLWDDTPAWAHPTHGRIMSDEGVTPDEMARHLTDEDVNLLPEGSSASDMWNALDKESKSAQRYDQAEREQTRLAKAEEAKVATAGKQDMAFEAAQDKVYKQATSQGKEAPMVRASDLGIEDKVTVDDQEFKVTNVTPDGVVTLEDGSRFGIQEVSGDQIIWGEHEPSPAAKAAPEFALEEPESPEEQVAREAREAEQKAASETEAEKKAQVKYGWAQKKTGTAGDLGQMELEQVEKRPEGDLFSQAQKLKIKAKNQGGFINPEVMKDAVDFGKRVYAKGMDFARWSGEMIRHLGEAIKEHLATIWRSITGAEFLPHARERGTLSLGGKFRAPGWWKAAPDPSTVGGISSEGAGSAHGLARVYIEEAIARRELPEIALAIGVGKTPDQMQAMGMDFLNKGGDLSKVIADLKRGIVDVNVTMPAIWAERQRLGEERRVAQLAALRRPGDVKAEASAKAAERNELNFLTTVRPLAGGATNKVMVAWQEAKPLSLLDFDGLYRAAIEKTGGQPLTREQRVEIARRADQGTKVKAREVAAVAKEIEQGKKVFPRKGPVTEQEMSATMENLRNRLPCA